MNTKKTQIVVLGLVHKNGKYLLTKRSSIDADDLDEFNGMWEIPGGGLEFGESPEDTLHRELHEELGVTVSIDTCIQPLMSEVRRDWWHGVFITYLCSLYPSDQQITLSHEASDYGWFDIEEGLTLPILPKVDEMLLSAKKYLQNE